MFQLGGPGRASHPAHCSIVGCAHSFLMLVLQLRTAWSWPHPGLQEVMHSDVNSRQSLTITDPWPMPAWKLAVSLGLARGFEHVDCHRCGGGAA